MGNFMNVNTYLVETKFNNTQLLILYYVLFHLSMELTYHSVHSAAQKQSVDH